MARGTMLERGGSSKRSRCHPTWKSAILNQGTSCRSSRSLKRLTNTNPLPPEVMTQSVVLRPLDSLDPSGGLNCCPGQGRLDRVPVSCSQSPLGSMDPLWTPWPEFGWRSHDPLGPRRYAHRVAAWEAEPCRSHCEPRLLEKTMGRPLRGRVRSLTWSTQAVTRTMRLRTLVSSFLSVHISNSSSPIEYSQPSASSPTPGPSSQLFSPVSAGQRLSTVF